MICLQSYTRLRNVGERHDLVDATQLVLVLSRSLRYTFSRMRPRPARVIVD